MLDSVRDLCECGTYKQDDNDTNQDPGNITSTTTINTSLFRNEGVLHHINFYRMNNGLSQNKNNQSNDDLNQSYNSRGNNSQRDSIKRHNNKDINNNSNITILTRYFNVFVKKSSLPSELSLS